MRLHTLTLTAIGPYVGTETIDFDALAADGLFLFTGPTGAGKSTVLDAVTYALYGKLPGTRDGHLARLKSDFAGPDVRPEVVLEATIGTERVRIHRSPAYERPKRRGDGVTLERSSVAVERRDGERWLGIEGARKENVANDWLQERIGLNCDQFTQVVLLPQGQFAEFLHASDDVREKLLTSLFNAHRFKDIENWFDDRQRAEAAAAAEAEAKVVTLRTKAQAIAGLGDDDLPEAVDVEWFADLAKTHQQRHDEALVLVAATSDLHSEAAQRVRDAEDIMARQRELATARELQQKVEAQREGIADLRQKHERAVAASAVLPLVDARERAESELADAASVLARSRDALVAVEPSLEGKKVADVRRRARALSKQRGALDEGIAAEQAIDGARTSLAKAQHESHEATSALVRLREQQQALPQRRAEAEVALSTLRARAAVLGDADTAVASLDAALSAARDAQHTVKRLDEARRYAVERAENVTTARERTLDLRERRLAGMAAELASELRTGVACVVCGSSEHPKPAQRSVDAPTPEETEAAEERLEQARKVKDLADKSVSDFQATLAAQTAAAGNRTVGQLRPALTAAQKRAADARVADAQLPAAEAALDAVDREAERIAAQVQTSTERNERLVADVRAKVDEVERLSTLIDAARGSDESVAVRAAAIDTAIEVVEAYANAFETHERAAGTLADAVAAADAAALDAEFESVAQAVAAALSKGVRAQAAAMITQFDKDEERAATLLSDPRLLDVPAEFPDLAELRTARDAARSDEHQARTIASREGDKATELAKLAQQSGTELTDALTKSARAAEIKALALLIRGMGANTKKMNLTAYFLAARLEQVTTVASEHLGRMSSGRYTLRHTDERLKARGHGGLGLEVFDAYTGKARPPHSLSGGETFYASVALALALAEVVTAETGAMTLDSLFIDEGFGSLDDDALDLAMRVLDELRQVGRTIGVISHVEEMKTRIPNQLVIERTDRGSRVLPHSS